MEIKYSLVECSTEDLEVPGYCTLIIFRLELIQCFLLCNKDSKWFKRETTIYDLEQTKKMLCVIHIRLASNHSKSGMLYPVAQKQNPSKMYATISVLLHYEKWKLR